MRNFDYTGGEQTWTTPYAGYYKLEVWGAQGGNVSTITGGYGGYAVGITKFDTNNLSYIHIGGRGGNYEESTNGGYNGGGNKSSTSWSAGGGGATHIAQVSGLLQNLSIYKGTLTDNSYYVSSKILIVAGAGAGVGCDVEKASSCTRGGDGYIGKTVTVEYGGCLGDTSSNCWGTGGSQTSGGKAGWYSTLFTGVDGSFGAGGAGRTYCSGCNGAGGGGGSGWHGGGGAVYNSGGGGSGYIGSSNLMSGRGITKHMTCYSCTTSAIPATYTISNSNVSATPTVDYSKIGNGYARITWMGDML